MAVDKEEEYLYEVLEEMLDLFPASLDVASDCPEAVPEIVETLTIVAICTNMLAVRDFGGRVSPARSNSLVEQVVAAAFQTYAGEDPHPHPFQKAAMLLRGINQGHPFGDGNKRTAFMLAMYYLERVGYPAPESLPRKEIVDFSLEVSAGRIRDIETIAHKLACFWDRPYP